MYYLYCYQCVGRPAALDCGHPERERRKSPSVIRGLDSPQFTQQNSTHPSPSHNRPAHTSLTFTQQNSIHPSPSHNRPANIHHLHTTEQHTSLTFTQQTSTLIPHIHKRTHTHTMVTSFALRKDEYTLVLYVVLLYDVTQLRR